MQIPGKLNEEIHLLFKRFVAGECLPEELAQVREYLAQGNFTEEWQVVLKEEADRIQDSDSASLEDIDLNEAKLYSHIKQTIGIPPQQKRLVRLWPRIAAAASILLMLSATGYLLLHTEKTQQTVQNQMQDVAPAKNQATLILANGQKIILTKSLSGKLAQQGNTTIQIQYGTSVTYSSSASPTNEVQYNTLSTARGQQAPYVLVLADGTKVWLNAASSITYPVAFNGSERKVTVTGEAYFQVIHNAAQPFRVNVKGQTIEDIGTEFNINAYDDEPVVRTTLAAGKIKIAKQDKSALLHPGQEAVTKVNTSMIDIHQADLENTLAWKNGYFIFDNENIESVMRKVSRWYDVDISYQGNIGTQNFVGSVSRFKNVSEVIRKLEATGTIHFKVEGKKITVMP